MFLSNLSRRSTFFQILLVKNAFRIYANFHFVSDYVNSENRAISRYQITEI